MPTLQAGVRLCGWVVGRSSESTWRHAAQLPCILPRLSSKWPLPPALKFGTGTAAQAEAGKKGGERSGRGGGIRL